MMRSHDGHQPGARHAAMLALALSVLALCATADAQIPAQVDHASERMIVVAVADRPELALAAGSTPHGYDGLRSYSGSDRAKALADRVGNDYQLREVSAWTIEVLHLRCLLFELPPAADRATTLHELGQDPRVRLAQPLQEFQTLGIPGAATPATKPAPAYNDPYIGLQNGFSAIDAGGAQQWTRGAGVRIALVDTGVDTGHPDLAGRVSLQRDFVPAPADIATTDRHGTEVAGVIVALANNGIGIAGIAPASTLLAYRACWPTEANADAARCNSYTLALALGAAIASGARIINLSLGGPSDRLLQELVGYALAHGVIVVAALPPSGRSDGFPVDVDGVIAVAAAGGADAAPHALIAPGRDILTLVPGGHYDYASGSSLASGHVSAAIALLLGIDPHLHADAAYALLKNSQRDPASAIDACSAVRTLRESRGLPSPDSACAR